MTLAPQMSIASRPALEAPAVPVGTLVIHGENDETVPLAAVLDWARPQELPVVLVPGADHFFHRKLQLIRRIVQANWR
jgi:alpha/beta superfamily hydrolase